MPNLALSNIPHLLITHPYCALRHAYPIWYYVCNRRAKSLFCSEKRALSALQQKLIKELKDTGSAVTNLGDLFPEENLLPVMQAEVERLKVAASQKTGKDFLRYLWGTAPTVNFEDPFIKFVLDKRIVDIVNGYMEMWAKFYFMTLNITIPVGRDAKAKQSQQWHRDSDDKKICKVFLYLTDVDSEAGPFFSAKGSQYGGRWRYLFGQRPPHGSRAPFGEVERRVPREHIREFTAPAGTIIFCDTSALHKGGYATAKERIMFTGEFASEASYKYNFYRAIKLPADYSKQVAYSALDDSIKYALNPPTAPAFMKIVNKLDSAFQE